MPDPRVETAWAADADAVAHVLHAGALDDELVIDGEDGHHLERVRRLRVGEVVTAGDGDGHWRGYRIRATARGTLTLEARSAVRVEPRLEPTLAIAFALTKGGKPDAVAARLTELGVDRLLPIVAARSVVRWKPSDHEPVDRLARVVREAAMQCRRARLPVIEPVRPLGDLAGTPGLVLADRAGVAPTELPDPGPDGWVVVVGPEGGLEPDEVQDLGPVGRLRIGPHVLRAETAAVAAASALSFRRLPAGDHGGWARGPNS